MSVFVRLILVTVLAGMFLTVGGCAALSLFDQTHTHHHHYDCESSDIANRLETMERRLAQMEHQAESGVQFSSHNVSE